MGLLPEWRSLDHNNNGKPILLSQGASIVAEWDFMLMVRAKPADRGEWKESFAGAVYARAFGFAKTPVVSSAKPMPSSGIGDDSV